MAKPSYKKCFFLLFVLDYKRKIMVRISTDSDMSDPGVQQQIIKQVREKSKLTIWIYLDKNVCAIINISLTIEAVVM